jgi:glycosyltransferase involved in cell wall biosynthesis
VKVLHAFNNHRSTWGSDKAWANTVRVSREAGIETAMFSRDSSALPPGWRGKARAFVGGIYAAEGVRAFQQTLASVRPDVVHAHELYPLISPWILPRCTAAGVPVVYTCYDYRLTCPIATHFANGMICRQCLGGREYRAVRNNCRGSLPESLAYAVRNATARGFRLYLDHVAQFIVPTEFGWRWLVREVGIAPERITIQPFVVPMPTDDRVGRADYIGFAGRFTLEKGSHLLIEAARRTGLPVRLAGNSDSHPAIMPGDPVICVPTRSPEELADFYRHARFLVVPSLWEETFSMVAAEAMSFAVPVLAARIGALPYTVRDGVMGMLFAPGDVDDLARCLRRLWDDPALCRRLGEAGRERVATEFDEASYVRNLRGAYDRAIAIGVGRRRGDVAAASQKQLGRG